VKDAEVVCVADAGDTAKEGAGEAALGGEDEGGRDVGCGGEAAEEAALEGEEGKDCGGEDCCCDEGGRLGEGGGEARVGGGELGEGIALLGFVAEGRYGLLSLGFELVGLLHDKVCVRAVVLSSISRR